MAIVPRETLLERIRNLIVEDTSDEYLSLLEDFNDTVNDYESRATDPENWKQKYEENDASWRARYRDRFFGGQDNPPPPATNTEQIVKGEEITIEDLFTEKE